MKRIFDFWIALCTLIVLLPVLLLICLTSAVMFRGNIFFRQLRPGLGAKPFLMFKFRSMSDVRGSDNQLLPDSERLTTYGRFLRATSLDELPALWNVIVGDMSLVGPRPLLVEYLELYTPEQARRHEVRPGITGWAQVNGRNMLDWNARFALDVWYVDNRTFFFDLKVLWLTVRKVLIREGISAEGQATMSRFSGNDS